MFALLLISASAFGVSSCENSRLHTVGSIEDSQIEEGYFPRLVAEKKFLLERPNGEQEGYGGRYLSGDLSKCVKLMPLNKRAEFLIFLLVSENATEFDGEIAYEFRNDFFASKFHETVEQVKMLLKGSDSLQLDPNDAVRVKEWLY